MRAPSSYKQPTGVKKDVKTDGVGYESKVNIESRPVTTQGLSGVKSVTGGPKRKVYDKSYYLNLLKSKNSEISTEITKFKKEVDTINKDNTTYLTLERKYDVLINDVRQLEGELADYNLTQDKFRLGTKPEDILVSNIF